MAILALMLLLISTFFFIVGIVKKNNLIKGLSIGGLITGIALAIDCLIKEGVL